MKKSIYSFLALSSLICAPATTFAYDVTLYGKADASVDYIDSGNDSETYIISNASFLGAKAEAELKEGIKGFGQFEIQYSLDGEGDKGDLDADTNDNPVLNSRNSGIGLKTDLGNVWFAGTWDEPVKGWSNGPHIDAFSLHLGQNSVVVGGDYRVKNAIFYETPILKGFQFQVAKGFSEGDEDNSKPGDAFTSDMMSGALRYELKDKEVGDIYLVFAARYENNPSGYDYDNEVYRLTAQYGRSFYSGSYTKGAFIYNIDTNTDDNREVTAYWGTLSHKINDWSVIVSYGMAEDDIRGQKQDILAGGIRYDFTKDFAIYAMCANSSLDDASLPALYNFGGNGRNEALTFPKGSDEQWGVSVGMAFRFNSVFSGGK